MKNKITFLWNYIDSPNDGIFGIVEADNENLEAAKPKDLNYPYRERHKFTGWGKDKYGEELYHFEHTLDEDLTLYALWEFVEDEADIYVTTDNDNNKSGYVTCVSVGGILLDGVKLEKKCDFVEDINAYYCDVDKAECTLDEDRLDKITERYHCQEEINELKTYLDDTDHKQIQYFEERELGLATEDDEKEFKECMQKRKDAREKIKKLEVICNAEL